MPSRENIKIGKSRLKGALALVLLYDQFTRNMYRDTPKMYMADARAWKLALRLTSGQKEHTLYLVERVFVYMPLMHAEDIQAQRLSVQYFAELVEESKEQKSRQYSLLQLFFGLREPASRDHRAFWPFPAPQQNIGTGIDTGGNRIFEETGFWILRRVCDGYKWKTVLLAFIFYGRHGTGAAPSRKRDKAPAYRQATFAGGCFWCMEPSFEKMDGVVEVIAGYTGGAEEDPNYEQVSTGQKPATASRSRSLMIPRKCPTLIF